MSKHIYYAYTYWLDILILYIYIYGHLTWFAVQSSCQTESPYWNHSRDGWRSKKNWVIKFWCGNFWPKGQKYMTAKQKKIQKKIMSFLGFLAHLRGDHLYNLLRFFTCHQKHDFWLIFGPITQKLRLKKKSYWDDPP